MSVIGIDFGNESCYVAVARAGGIETIANDYSLRSTPSCVAFLQKNRVLGVAAKNQMVTNMKNTAHGFKRLLGRNFTDPYVETEIKHLPFQCVATSTGGIGIKVNFLNESRTFSPEQITAMLLTKLKDISETALKTKVHDCVISVPSYFTNNERKALLDAASIAGLNVLRLFNETTATALAYGIYKQDLPEDKPRNVVFVDFGHASLQVSACAFHKGKLKMLASASDISLGGRDIDDLLAGHFADDFKRRYNIDARGNPRAWLRLTSEVEKIKKQMSANSTKLPLNIECFMEDKDVSGSMQRADMEVMCAALFQRAGVTMRKCLEDSKLKLDEIYAVEIVGGSSRIPAIKHLIEDIFKHTPSTTLNQDEAVSRGCALQCAMLSPAIRVRDFNVTDVQSYPIKLTWGEDGEMEAFAQNHPVPFSKMLSFFRKESFPIKAYYSGNIPYPDPFIGEYIVKDVKPTSDGDSQKVKVKVRVNLNGITAVVAATLVEKLHPSEQQSGEGVQEEGDSAMMDTDPENHPGAAAGKEAGEAAPEPSSPAEKKDKKKKQLVKVIDLPIESNVAGYTSGQIDNYHEEECKMISADRQEKERVDARNALEEYVYDLRGKLASEEELAFFVPDAVRDALCRQLDATETWLYEDGEDCPRNIYFDRLKSLKTDGEPIKNRRAECDSRPAALHDLTILVQLTRKVLDQYHQGDERYAHLLPADMDKVAAAVEASAKWLEETRVLLASASRTADPPTTCAKIREEKQSLENVVSPILNKPKPVVEPLVKKEEPVADFEVAQEQGDVPPPDTLPGEEGMDVE